jgi:hypothetical protein
MNPLQGASKLDQQRVELRTDANPAPFYETGDGRPVSPRDLLEGVLVGRLATLGEPRALEKLVGDALKGRDDDNEGLPPAFIQQYPADVPDDGRRRQRRATEFENSHG